ncbi:MAG: hypothetical protein Q8916_14870, partial [Bacteroidota bacterium]|nr:hypothetical protein [Bacteroidota bacterium]
MRKTLLLLFLFAGSLSAQQLEYEVNLHTSATHKVQVFVNFKKLSSKTFTYQMPIWAPGAYSVTHYGHYVTDFEAHDRQMRPLAVKQIDGDRWEVPDAKNLSGISYFVGDSHKDSTSLYFALANIDTNFFFANGTCLFGYVNDKKNIPSIVTYNIPKDWQLATALDSFAFRMWTSDLDKYYELRPKNNVLTFKAKNYDKLADAPV